MRLQFVAILASAAATAAAPALLVGLSTALGPETERARAPLAGLALVVGRSLWEARHEIRRERARKLERWRSDPVLVGRREP